MDNLNSNVHSVTLLGWTAGAGYIIFVTLDEFVVVVTAGGGVVGEGRDIPADILVGRSYNNTDDSVTNIQTANC